MTEDHGEPTAYRRRGEALWRRTTTEQQHSDLTQLEFCSRNDLALSTFQRWRQRLQNVSAQPQEPAAPEFVAVEVCSEAEPDDPSDSFELIFHSGLRLRLPSRVEGRALAEVLSALEVAGVC